MKMISAKDIYEHGQIGDYFNWRTKNGNVRLKLIKKYVFEYYLHGIFSMIAYSDTLVFEKPTGEKISVNERIITGKFGAYVEHKSESFWNVRMFTDAKRDIVDYVDYLNSSLQNNDITTRQYEDARSEVYF